MPNSHAGRSANSHGWPASAGFKEILGVRLQHELDRSTLGDRSGCRRRLGRFGPQVRL
jgi:hypothetical protein